MARLQLVMALSMALCGATVSLGQNVILQDTYQDDVIGDPPNGPEVGSYIQISGNHMIDDFGGGDLKLLSHSQAGDGYVINMRPIADAAVAETTYEYLIFGNALPSGQNAFTQQWILRPLGDNLSLWWGDDQQLRVHITRVGGASETIATGFTWNSDTTYYVSVATDALADTFSIRINGSPVLVDEPFGADFTHLYSLAFADNFATAALRLLNDVRIVNDTCASETTPPIAELNTPPHLGTGCTCTNPQIIGTADDPEVGLGSYVVEYRPTSGGTWQEIASGTDIVIDDVLGTWANAGVSEGYYTIRLRVTNACGLSSSDVRTIFLDKQFSSLELRSPGSGTVLGRRICLDGTVFDSWCFDQYMVEYRPAGGGGWLPVDPDMPVYTSSVVNDPFAYWETVELGVPDGDYDLRVTAQTDCGNTDSVMTTVVVDNTAPLADITNIDNCDQLDGVVPIVGTAADANLESWSLQYLGGDATSWVTIASGTASVVDDILGRWDTTGLRPCPYVLRLTVVDEAILNCDADNRHLVRIHRTVLVGDVCLHPGDMNCDGAVNFDDISLFVEAQSYAPDGVGWPYDCPWLNADCNDDGAVNFDDIEPFVDLIAGT